MGAAMLHQCEACGESFVARSPRARFCGPTCRSRAHRGTVVTLRPSEAPRAPATSGNPDGLVESTRLTLTAAGREQTPTGFAALELARTITDPATPPGAKATLTKEFRATLAEALKGVAVASTVDDLRSRRAARRTG